MLNITGKEAVNIAFRSWQKVVLCCIIVHQCVICRTVFFAQWKLSTTLQNWMIILLYFNLDTLQVMVIVFVSKFKRKTPEQEILVSERTQGKEPNLLALVLESCFFNWNKIWIINLLFLLLLFINPRIRMDGLLVSFSFYQKSRLEAWIHRVKHNKV